MVAIALKLILGRDAQMLFMFDSVGFAIAVLAAKVRQWWLCPGSTRRQWPGKFHYHYILLSSCMGGFTTDH